MLRDVREKIESDAETDEGLLTWAEKFAADLDKVREIVVETTEGDNEGPE